MTEQSKTDEDRVREIIRTELEHTRPELFEFMRKEIRAWLDDEIGKLKVAMASWMIRTALTIAVTVFLGGILYLYVWVHSRQALGS